MFYIGLIIVISCIIYLFVAFNKNSFINFKEIYENYNSIFKKFSESFPFKILPFIFGLGLSFIVSYSEEVLIQLIVFISIIISMLFASFSVILSRDILKNKEINDSIAKKVLNQTHSIIILEILVSIILLILILIYISLYDCITLCNWLMIMYNFLISSCLIYILFNLLIIFKRIYRLIEFK